MEFWESIGVSCFRNNIPLYIRKERNPYTTQEHRNRKTKKWKKKEFLGIIEQYDYLFNNKVRRDCFGNYDYHADPIAIIYIRSNLRLVTDLQTCVKAQQSQVYAHKVKLTNLKQMAETIVYVQEHSLFDISSLETILQTAGSNIYVLVSCI